MKAFLRNEIKAILLLLGLTLLFFSPNLFRGEVLYFGDNLQINIPSKVLLVEMVKNKTLPLWNPYIFSGSPFLADINLGLLYPLNIFYFVFNPFRALTLIVVLEIFLAGIFTYDYARTLKLGRTAAFLTASLFMFSGTVVHYMHNTAILNVVVWIPLVLALNERFFRTKKWRFGIFTAIVLTLQIFAGHFQFFYYTVVVLTAYVIFRFQDNLLVKIKFLGTVFFLAGILGAVQLVPFFKFAQISTRPAGDFEFASFGSLPPILLVTFILPNIFGVLKNGTSWGAQASTSGYLGILPLFFAGLAIFRVKKRVVYFYSLLGIVCLLLALGKLTPVFFLFYKILPGFGRFRCPTRVLVFYSLSVAVLAGFGFEKFKSVRRSWQKLIFFLPVLMIIFLGMKIFGFSLFANFAKNLPYLGSYATFKLQTIFSLWLDNLLIATGILLTFFLVNKFFSKQKKLLVIILVVDLFIFRRNVYFTAHPEIFNLPQGAVSFLKNNGDDYRILAIADGPAKPPYGDPNYFKNESLKTMALLRPNVNILAHIKSIDGYAAMVDRGYASYLAPDRSSSATGIEIPAFDDPKLSQIGLKYVITGGNREEELIKLSQYRLVFSYSDTALNRVFKIYENTKALPQ